jgi:hypothetical protein
MGHHVWKIIMSKSVFTRVTDGTRLCYYSIYVICALGVIVIDALCVHYFVAGGQTSESETVKIGELTCTCKQFYSFRNQQ